MAQPPVRPFAALSKAVAQPSRDKEGGREEEEKPPGRWATGVARLRDGKLMIGPCGGTAGRQGAGTAAIRRPPGEFPSTASRPSGTFQELTGSN